MGKYKIILKPTAEKDLLRHKKSGDSAVLNKITAIFKELEEHPYTGIGKPEMLKYEMSGLWSRRINQKDRIIYEINEDIVTVLIFSAIGHYNDK